MAENTDSQYLGNDSQFPTRVLSIIPRQLEHRFHVEPDILPIRKLTVLVVQKWNLFK